MDGKWRLRRPHRTLLFVHLCLPFLLTSHTSQQIQLLQICLNKWIRVPRRSVATQNPFFEAKMNTYLWWQQRSCLQVCPLTIPLIFFEVNTSQNQQGPSEPLTAYDLEKYRVINRAKNKKDCVMLLTLQLIFHFLGYLFFSKIDALQNVRFIMTVALLKRVLKLPIHTIRIVRYLVEEVTHHNETIKIQRLYLLW